MGDQTPPGDEMISVRIFHGGKLNWFPVTKYVGGQLSVYDFWDELTLDNLRLKTNAFGYSGLKCLYFRKPKLTLETGLVLIKAENDFMGMIAHARENNNMIDIYIKHTDDTALGAFEDENVFRSNEGNESNDVGNENDEVDD